MKGFHNHGGNNSFCEALYWGVPSIVMPYCWDGHDNARRAVETGTGYWMKRTGWTREGLVEILDTALNDTAMRARLQANSRLMIDRSGVDLAAERILAVAAQNALPSAGKRQAN